MNFMPDWMMIEKTLPRGEKANADFMPEDTENEKKINNLSQIG